MTEPENRQIREQDAWLRVPASARPAERHRYSDPVDDDENDEDVDFLKALAQQAAREVKPIDGEPPPPRKFDVKAEDALDVFKESYVERPRARVLNTIRIDAVELDDLLEQLSTTAAALRRRKAA
jgi:hypothetical protein